MGQSQTFAAILSADVVGSTALYESMGDSDARNLVGECIASMKQYCADNNGRTIAEVGDQIVALFDSAADAASAASEIHVELHEKYGKAGDGRIRMRIGLHYGPIPATGDILAGESAKVANWASGNAKSEQTLATRPLIDQLPRIFRSVSRYVDDETWNFISQEHMELYEVIWDVEAITAYGGEQPVREDGSYEHVVFEYGGSEITVDTARPVVSIGRHENNDLVIDRDLISRQHLSVQFSRGRCTVTDNSTNGTAIRTENGETFDLKRESFRLSGAGDIVLGRPGPDETGYVIRFRCA